jgi:RepB DNA-primase from phage plasmid
VADVDNDKRAEAPLPFLSSCRLETSPGNFQDFFVFPQPLTFAMAKPVLRALNRLTGGDAAEQDASSFFERFSSKAGPTRREPHPAYTLVLDDSTFSLLSSS